MTAETRREDTEARVSDTAPTRPATQAEQTQAYATLDALGFAFQTVPTAEDPS